MVSADHTDGWRRIVKCHGQVLLSVVFCCAAPALAEKSARKKQTVEVQADAGSPAPIPGKVPLDDDTPRMAAPEGDGAFDDVPSTPHSRGARSADPTAGADQAAGIPSALWAVIVLLAAALGAAAGWLARGKQVPPIRTSSTREDRSATASSSTPRLSPAAVGGPAGLAGATAGPLAPSGRNPLPPRPAPGDSPMGGQPAQPFAPPPPTNPGLSTSSPLAPQEASALPPARIGRGGALAHVLEPLDRGYQWFAAAATAEYIVQRFPEVADDVHQFDYLVRVLIVLSDEGSTAYQTSTGDQLSVDNFDTWLNIFAANVLDVLSVRCSKYLLEGADSDGSAEAQAVGDIYLELLRHQVPEALRAAGFDAVPAFPFQGDRPSTETMRVVGNAYRSSHSGQIIGLRKYGLMKGRKLIRQAHVMVG